MADGSARAADIVVRLELRSIDQLFRRAEADPFDAAARARPGVDDVYRSLRLSGAQESEIVLCLPPSELQPDLASRTKAALDRYCAERIADATFELAVNRRDGWWGAGVATALGSLVVVVLILVNYLSEADSTFLTIFNGLMSIAAWVIVWWPIEKLIYDPREMLEEVRVYETIQRATLTIEPM